MHHQEALGLGLGGPAREAPMLNLVRTEAVNIHHQSDLLHPGVAGGGVDVEIPQSPPMSERAGIDSGQKGGLRRLDRQTHQEQNKEQSKDPRCGASLSPWPFCF